MLSKKDSIEKMTPELRPQQDLKADVKRWLKARGLDYNGWLKNALSVK